MYELHWLTAIALLASGFVAFFGPLALALYIWKRTDAGAIPWVIGAATFCISQLVLRLPWQIPLGIWIGKRIGGNFALGLAWMAASALTAALFEEFGRYFAIRWFVKKERSWRVGVMMGAGHGGIESMLLVGISLLSTAVVYVLFAMKPELVPAEGRDAIVKAFSKLTALDAFAGGVERVLAVAGHVAMSVLVMTGFERGKPFRWLGYALLMHFCVDFFGVWAAKATTHWTGSALLGELPLVPTAVVGGIIIFALRPRATSCTIPAS